MNDAESLTTERGAVYGHPRENFRRIAALQAVTAECKDPLLKVAADMICVKLSRIVETPNHEDSWRDIMGYARTALMILGKE